MVARELRVLRTERRQRRYGEKHPTAARYRGVHARRAGQRHGGRRGHRAGPGAGQLCAVRLLYQRAAAPAGVRRAARELERCVAPRHRGGGAGPRAGGRQLDPLGELWQVEPLFAPRRPRPAAARPAVPDGGLPAAGQQDRRAGAAAHLPVHQGRKSHPGRVAAGRQRAHGGGDPGPRAARQPRAAPDALRDGAPRPGPAPLDGPGHRPGQPGQPLGRRPAAGGVRPGPAGLARRRRRRCAQPELCRRRGRLLGVPGVGVLVRPGDAARRGAPRLRRAGGAAKHPRPAAKRLAAAPVRDGAGVPPYRRHAQGAAVRPLGRRQRF